LKHRFGISTLSVSGVSVIAFTDQTSYLYTSDAFLHKYHVMLN